MRTDSFAARSTLDTGLGRAVVYRLSALADRGLAPGLDRLPFSIRVLLESVLRNLRRRARHRGRRAASGRAGTPAALADVELPFMPARVILQDFTGVPAVVDLAAMREAREAAGRRPAADQPARSRSTW